MDGHFTGYASLFGVPDLGRDVVVPGAFAAIATAEIARVNLPVAVLIWLMIIPMLLKIDFGALGSVLVMRKTY